MLPSLRQNLENLGWTIECESPLEIRHADGSFATKHAAITVAAALADEDSYVIGGFNRFFSKCQSEGWDRPNYFLCVNLRQINLFKEYLALSGAALPSHGSDGSTYNSLYGRDRLALVCRQYPGIIPPKKIR